MNPKHEFSWSRLWSSFGDILVPVPTIKGILVEVGGVIAAAFGVAAAPGNLLPADWQGWVVLGAASLIVLMLGVRAAYGHRTELEALSEGTRKARDEQRQLVQAAINEVFVNVERLRSIRFWGTFRPGKASRALSGRRAVDGDDRDPAEVRILQDLEHSIGHYRRLANDLHQLEFLVHLKACTQLQALFDRSSSGKDFLANAAGPLQLLLQVQTVISTVLGDRLSEDEENVFRNLLEVQHPELATEIADDAHSG